jgi:nucleoside-diphosphate-sugar epimerase
MLQMETPADSKHKPRGRKPFRRPRLLIVGCGDVGLRIVARLRDRFRIIATTATALRIVELRAAGTVPLVVNLDIAPNAKRLRGLAPWWIDLAPPPAFGNDDPRTRRLRCASGKKVDRAVYISTTGVYGDRQGAVVDETAQPRPATDRAKRRLAAEAIMRARPIHASVLRVPGIYAANRLPVDRLRAGTPALRAEEDVYTNHIHADDLARLTIATLFRGAPARLYNAVDDSELKMGEFFDRVAVRLKMPRPPRLSRATLKAAVSPAQYSFMSESRRLANRRIKHELRMRLLYPTVDATLAAMRS